MLTLLKVILHLLGLCIALLTLICITPFVVIWLGAAYVAFNSVSSLLEIIKKF
jgi:hypothetical protein